MRPISGLTAPDTTKPNEKAPAVTPRSHPNSEMIGGKNSENAVRALTPIAMVTKVTPTISQPWKKGKRIRFRWLEEPALRQYARRSHHARPDRRSNYVN